MAKKKNQDQDQDQGRGGVEPDSGDAVKVHQEDRPKVVGAAGTGGGGGVVPLDDQPGPEPDPEPVPEGPVFGMVPYPYRAMILPEGGPIMPGEDSRSDLIIGREWVEIPTDQLDRAKRTALRSGIKLELMIPDPDNSEE